MRKPTAKERSVLEGALEGLRADVEALATEPTRDVFGTTRVNLQVIKNIVDRLEQETE